MPGGILAAQDWTRWAGVRERAVAIHTCSAGSGSPRLRDRLACSMLPRRRIGDLAWDHWGSFFGLEVIPGYGPAKTGRFQAPRALALGLGQAQRSRERRRGRNDATQMFARFIVTLPSLARSISSHERRLGRHGVPGDINGTVCLPATPLGRRLADGA
ncbi:MAG: hypothetical protein IPN48_09080 [Sphingomonadales bacterium]|nr:hypothetical protein [Sphingomonadales bacterium]